MHHRDLLQVQQAVKCRVVDRQEDVNGDSGGSFQNGHAQLMVWLHADAIFTLFYYLLFNIYTRTATCVVFCPQTDFEKDVDIACRSGELQCLLFVLF